jgi:predicted ABC-class ATPase
MLQSIEMGADTLLVDEDTCATNFMIRDNKMAKLVATEKEPITPFVRVVRSIYETRGISTVLVIGGAGDYFDVADHVLLMDCYKCEDATERAKQIVSECNKSSGPHPSSEVLPFGTIRQRYPTTKEFSANGKVKVTRRGIISYGETELDLTGLEQIVSTSQTNAISAALQKVAASEKPAGITLYDVLKALDAAIDDGGLEVLAPGHFNGAMARPRLLEIAGAVNRLRQDGSIKQL